MSILTIPQLELLIFLESSMIPEWVLKSSGYGIEFRDRSSYGYGLGVGSGHGYGYPSGIWKK